ncbi:WYL domain-containing protein [Sulfurovum sp.]|uniref:helix-turn-helix transcriptional regulator n=1 Tax=Sulfurovum sp. TaxID=1969726 RepID=UPI002A3626A2|nr:WYL domain-containing protein [Sulfurovum sp.]MDY0401994.1 WYL domain-containing protein [Sulfurovum sp.]
MAYQKQKTPTPRILDIVRRLYAGERLSAGVVSVEYGVSSRTIHRDMLKIAQSIPLQNRNGIWSLDRTALSKGDNDLNHILLSSFARNLEIEVECLERSNLSSEKISFAVEYKNLPKKLGEALAISLMNDEKCSFVYLKAEGSSERVVDPIKIYTENGRWYLIARDYKDDGIKYFNLDKIRNFGRIEEKQTLTPEMIAQANNMKSIWSSTGKETFRVVLYIKPEIAEYIKDIKLHKSQIIEDEHYDGGLEVHCEITHKLEILPQIKYWLPRVHIIEPKWLWEELMGDLEIYQEEERKIRG